MSASDKITQIINLMKSEEQYKNNIVSSMKRLKSREEPKRNFGT